MKRTRLDTAQSPFLGVPRWPTSGYGTVHVQHWRLPHELMRCWTSGCSAFLAFGPRCSECGGPTEPLWQD